MRKFITEVLDILKAAVIIGALAYMMATNVAFAMVFTALLIAKSVEQARDERWDDDGIL